MRPSPRTATAASMFLLSFGLILFELALTRIFGVVLFASYAHLALALALLGISIGALAQHLWPSLMPDEGLERRLGAISLVQGVAAVAAVVVAVTVPVTVQFEQPPAHYGERSAISMDLVDPFWFSVLLPVLTVPFIAGGLAFAGVFQRRKEDIGLMYGADLVGGAIGAVAFLPVLYVLPAPDASLVVMVSSALSAALLFVSIGDRLAARVSAAFGAVALVGLIVSASGTDLLRVRYSAGYSEENVTWTRWTPLTRLAIHEDARGTYMLLDNSSASQIVTDRPTARKLAREPNRSLVYALHEPPARVAILAASAGPEVAVARFLGFEQIDAIDIAPEIGDAVANRFADAPFNPYLGADVQRVLLDGRAAVLHAHEPYDIIQMVHANLWSSAGQLSNAWSPALLETREAFVTYLDRLTPDGTISFGRGNSTRQIARSAFAALRQTGAERPIQHMLVVRGRATVLLVKKRPFTAAEVDKVRAWCEGQQGQHIFLDPLNPSAEARKWAVEGPLLTDDRPYLDNPSELLDLTIKGAKLMFARGDEEVEPFMVVYHQLALQVIFVVLAGLAFVAVPVLRRAPTGLGGIEGLAPGLLYFSCLGYGYLAVETVLVHELVLFVGHPVYAITVVILAMLLSSGFGSIAIQRVAPERLVPTLRMALVAVLVLGALHGLVVGHALQTYAFGLPIEVRMGLTFASLIPLGFVMGTPFPLAMRILRPEASGMVPWAWALNGWMSVAASLGTVILSRTVGYTLALQVALGTYLLALLLVPRLARIGRSDVGGAERPVASSQVAAK